MVTDQCNQSETILDFRYNVNSTESPGDADWVVGLHDSVITRLYDGAPQVVSLSDGKGAHARADSAAAAAALAVSPGGSRAQARGQRVPWESV